MEKQTNYFDEMIDRYIYQVMKSINSKNKNDIEDELRTLIADMLEDKTGGNSPSKTDLDAVLKELGNPYDLSQKYCDSSCYLIGPAIYPTYNLVLKIVLYATLLGMVIATFLSAFATVSSNWVQVSVNFITNIFNGLLASFAWVTIIFAIMERKGVTINKNNPEWEPSLLPPTPSKELAIPLRKPITGIIFNILAVIIFVFAPQILGAYVLNDTTRVIPIFDLDVLKTVIPLLIFIIGLSLVKNIWEIIEQKITMRYAVSTAIIDALQMLSLVILLTRFRIWNNSFLTEQNSLFHMEGNLSYDDLWSRLNTIIIAAFGLIYLLECFTLLYKVLKYGNR